MNIKSIVGDNIRGYRKKIAWTQEKLGIRAKINSEHLSRLENGLENATLETIEKLAKSLKVDPYLFFIENAYQKTPEELKKALLL
jgi:transcriptional regulator with XRE-family HTH domain